MQHVTLQKPEMTSSEHQLLVSQAPRVDTDIPSLVLCATKLTKCLLIPRTSYECLNSAWCHLLCSLCSFSTLCQPSSFGTWCWTGLLYPFGGTRQACQTLAWNLRRWKMIFWPHPRMGTSTASLAYAGRMPRLRIPHQMLRGDGSHIESVGFRLPASKYCSI